MCIYISDPDKLMFPLSVCVLFVDVLCVIFSVCFVLMCVLVVGVLCVLVLLCVCLLIGGGVYAVGQLPRGAETHTGQTHH